MDAVEVVMAIEEEFAIEIPDEEADAITSVGQGACRRGVMNRGWVEISRTSAIMECPIEDERFRKNCDIESSGHPG